MLHDDYGVADNPLCTHEYLGYIGIYPPVPVSVVA